MKRTIKFLALAIALAVFAVPAVAQTKECNDENKGAWYKTFYDNFKGDAAQQKVAYDAAKTYIGSCPADPNDKQLPYMEKWTKKYDEVMGKAEAAKKFEAAVTSKNYADQIRYGKEVLAGDPENAPVNIVMGVAGLYDATVLADSAQAAKKAISLIEAGKPFAPIASKDQALGYLNWVVAKSVAKSDPNGAITYFIKAARYEADPKKNPLLYNELAAAYGEGPVAKLAEDYKKFVGQPESNESKLVLANLNQALDRQIDAFARAAALSSNAEDKKRLVDVITELYKSRNQDVAAVDALVANVLSKPLPDAPTPITSLPTTSATTTPAATPGAAAGTNGSTPAAPQTGNAKPAASPSPVKKP
jgi:hypothetical protein